MKIGIVQHQAKSNAAENRIALADKIKKLADSGAELVVLQELHDQFYFCQTESSPNFDLAERIPGPSTGFYGKVAADNKIVLVTSMFEKRTAGIYHNTAVVFEADGSIAGTYRKMHIQMILDTTKNFTLLLETKVLNPLKPPSGNWA